MTRSRLSAGTINCAIVALRFFFRVTLGRPDLVSRLAFVHQPRKAPVVLSQEEVARLLEAASGVKYKAALGIAYGAGLRASEVVALKVTDIDGQRMTLRVEQGKCHDDGTQKFLCEVTFTSRDDPAQRLYFDIVAVGRLTTGWELKSGLCKR